MCGVAEFYAALQEAPREAVLCLGAAAHLVDPLLNPISIFFSFFFLTLFLVWYSIFEQALCVKEKSLQLEDIEKINVRLYNHTESMIALRNLKAAYISNASLFNFIACRAMLFFTALRSY